MGSGESPRGDKAALPGAHVNQSRSKDMMSVYRETGQAGPGSSGSRILIIPRRKSGIGLPRHSAKSGGQNLHSNLEQPGSSQGSLFLWKWERMSPVQRVQPSQVSTCGMLCCGELWAILALRVGACSAAGCGSVSTRGDLSLHVFWGKEKSTSLITAQCIIKKNPLAFRRARKGLIRSYKRLALCCQ